MLYFYSSDASDSDIVQTETLWRVGETTPSLYRVIRLYVNGPELVLLQSLGFARSAKGNVWLDGDRAREAYTALGGRPKSNKPEWIYNTPINFWELSTPEQMVYAAAYAAEFKGSHNKAGFAPGVAKNALYSFWRTNGNPRFSFPNDRKFRFGDDDWGY